MKKFRPYTKFPDNIVGKQVRVTSTGNITTVIALDTKKNFITLPAPTCSYNANEIFDGFTFLDGTPVGELYEEVVELEFDKVYLVRNHDRDYWQPRFFSRCVAGGAFLFYDCGTSSKTTHSESNVTIWSQVCDYNKEIVGKNTEPTEYLIKQN